MILGKLESYKFYRISTDINGKIFLEFTDAHGNSVRLKYNIIKKLGISIYHNDTLADLFQWNNNTTILKDYIIK